MRFRMMRDRSGLDAEASVTPLGFKFLGDRQMQAGRFEPDETRLVSELLEDVDTFINVGANIGYYCCIALSKGKPTIAFEPIETNLQYLARNVSANGWDDLIEIFPIALSDRVGIARIWGGGTGASLIRGWAGTPDAYVRFVPTSTADRLLAGASLGKKVLVVMDIEGAELCALRGASELLGRRPKPLWMVEIVVDANQPAGTNINPSLFQTFSIFWNAGYSAYTVERVPRLITEVEIAEVAKSGRNTLAVHNFLFLDSATKLGDWASKSC
jgi:FkbM family methyltransferase